MQKKILDTFNTHLTEGQKNNNATNDSTLFSIKEDEYGFYVDVDVDQDIFDGLTTQECISVINKYMAKKFKGKVFPVSKNSTAYVGRIGVNEYSHPAKRNMKETLYDAKLKAGTELDNLLAVSVYENHVADSGHHPEAVGGWDYYKTIFKVGNKFYKGIVKIELRNNGREFKDITEIEEITRNASQSANAPADTSIPSNTNVPQNSDGVNNNSMQETEKHSYKESVDSEGRTLSKEQQEYFKDSKVRDKDGNLLVVYRGGSKNDYTVFDRKKSKPSNMFGRGFYFTETKSHAEQYGTPREFYLNIKNPLTDSGTTFTDEQIRNFVQAVADDEDYGIENYGYGATVDSVVEQLK